jgi:IS5 family transposase
LSSKVPDDATTVWLFWKDLIKAGIGEKIFSTFDTHLRANGFDAKKDQIDDASIVNVPKKRKTRDENNRIKNGETLEWPENKKRQKDVDARWTKKNGKTFFGYNNHIEVDTKCKFIKSYRVTSASVHGRNVFVELLNDLIRVAMFGQTQLIAPKKNSINFMMPGIESISDARGHWGQKLTDWEPQGNHTRSKTSSRVEHVFDVQAQKAGNLLLRTVGILLAKVKIGLRNLACNID